MIGTILNAGAIIVGGALGLTVKKEFSPRAQLRVRVLLGAYTVYAGIAMALNGFAGTLTHRLAQLGIGLLALTLGNLGGKLLRLQRGVNRLGKVAQVKFASTTPETKARWSNGFVACSLVFCLGPLAIVGAVQDGLLGTFRVLVAKAVLDGLAAFGFAKSFGWSVLAAAIPLLAYQGSITLGAEAIEPYLRNIALLESISLAGGIIVFAVSLMVLDLGRVAVADYLPSLGLAPLLTHFLLPR